MSNKILADDTRKTRNLLSKMVLECLEGWEEEYEQIRFDDKPAIKKTSEEKVNRAVTEIRQMLTEREKSDGPKTDKEDRIVQRILL